MTTENKTTETPIANKFRVVTNYAQYDTIEECTNDVNECENFIRCEILRGQDGKYNLTMLETYND